MILLLMGVGVVHAHIVDNINIAWTPPTSRADNTALSLNEIQGYKIYYGTSKSNYSQSIVITGGNVKNYQLSLNVSSTYYIVLTTIDTDGRESVFSIEKEVFVPARPSKPTFTFGKISPRPVTSINFNL